MGLFTKKTESAMVVLCYGRSGDRAFSTASQKAVKTQAGWMTTDGYGKMILLNSDGTTNNGDYGHWLPVSGMPDDSHPCLKIVNLEPAKEPLAADATAVRLLSLSPNARTNSTMSLANELYQQRGFH